MGGIGAVGVRRGCVMLRTARYPDGVGMVLWYGSQFDLAAFLRAYCEWEEFICRPTDSVQSTPSTPNSTAPLKPGRWLSGTGTAGDKIAV